MFFEDVRLIECEISFHIFDKVGSRIILESFFHSFGDYRLSGSWQL